LTKREGKFEANNGEKEEKSESIPKKVEDHIYKSYRILMYTKIKIALQKRKTWTSRNNKLHYPPKPQFVHQFVTILIPLHEIVVLCARPTTTLAPRKPRRGEGGGNSPFNH
jgi:hypothetical protein